MREIGPIRQDGEDGSRRWFQDAYFDLYVWQDGEGRVIGFQLCYDRGRNEGVLAWSSASGFGHGRVDAGERAPHAAMTPLVRREGPPPPYFRIYQHFLGATAHWEPALRRFVLMRLHEYRRLLFGSPRAPRRPKRMNYRQFSSWLTRRPVTSNPSSHGGEGSVER